MKELIKGANAPLATSGKIRLHLSGRAAPNDIDLACFALNARDQVPSDSWFLFYNQPSSPDGAIRFDPRTPYFLIDLSRLPAEIKKCVFIATPANGHLASIHNLTFEATAATGDGARFRLTEPVNGHSLLIAELYRHNEQWKIRAKGDGLKEDLATLARHFGVEVQDDENRNDVPSAPRDREPITRRRTPAPVSETASPPPAPEPTASPRSAPDPVPTPPPAPANPPASPYDKHEKLKTYATLAIAFGSLTTAMTTLITQCTPHTAVVMMQPATSPTPSPLPSETDDSTPATRSTPRTITQSRPDSETDSTPARGGPHSPYSSWNNR